MECIEVVTQPHEAEVPQEFEETQFDEPPAQQIHIPEPVVGDYEVYQVYRRKFKDISSEIIILLRTLLVMLRHIILRQLRLVTLLLRSNLNQSNQFPCESRTRGRLRP